MSRYFSWQHAIIKSQLEPTTRHVCLTIGCHMAADGSGCFPSYQHIADETGLSRRSVIEHVAKAAEAGYLAVDARQRDNGSATSNIYYPTMPGGGERAALGSEPASPGGSEPGSPLLTDHSSNRPDNSLSTPTPTKASKRADPVRSIAILLEDLVTIPENLRLAAECKHNIPRLDIDGEWAKFRNHHISARSKHTRIDLCWDTWCRRAAEFKARRGATAGGGAGQSGFKRYDHVAAAKDRALDELFPDRAKGHAGAPAATDTGPDPFGGGEDAIDAVFVDVGQGADTRQHSAGGAGGGDTHSDGRTPLPLEVE
ncbi:MAG: helix-turn-helix domain-containing protein [Mesorhizobium sp.]|nr:MAG: helix-turn-helix domain-containing protein [Mesorhizobium sp.]